MLMAMENLVIINTRLFFDMSLYEVVINFMFIGLSYDICVFMVDCTNYLGCHCKMYHFECLEPFIMLLLEG
jgi:hypothetical protein